MITKIKSYIVFLYFKNLFILLFAFLLLIWVSQILRILDVRFSISGQIFEILGTTLLALPSYVNPILPIIMIISFFLFNNHLMKSNEELIINLYLNKKIKILINFIISGAILIMYIINSEFISPITYKLYKQNEVDLRNQIKLGIPKDSQFNIENELTIFFESNSKNLFLNIEALIYKKNQFIVADKAEILTNQDGFNIIFHNGIRIKMNDDEKSKTIFEKFIYNIDKKKVTKLSLDKDHYNTYQLLNSDNLNFKNYGHTKILYHFLMLIIFANMSKFIYITKFKNQILKSNIYLFTFCILIYLVNSYLLQQLNLENITLIIYYLANLISLGAFHILIQKYNAFN